MAQSRKQKRGGEPPVPRNRKGGAPIIEMRDVTKVYSGGHMALDRVSLAIDRASSSSSSALPGAASRP